MQLFFLDPIAAIVIVTILAITILYYYRPILWRIRNFMAFKSLTKSEETSKRPARGIGCPKCGGSMRRGYLVSSRFIYWSTQPFQPFIFSPRRVPFLPHNMASIGRGTSLPAFRCESCEIIHVDASDVSIV